MGEKDVAAALRALLADVDRVPDTAVQGARAAIGWRDLDAELAQLAAESGLELTHLRGGQPRLLTYRNGDTVIELEVSTDDGAARLLGQLDPPRRAAVTVESDAGPQATEATEADAVGRFSFTGLRAGWMRVIVTETGAPETGAPETGAPETGAPAAGGGRIATEWFRA